MKVANNTKTAFSYRLAGFISLLIISLSSPAADTYLVAGAGPSTELVKLFFEHFTRQPGFENYDFEVPQRSIKHAGGLRASDHTLFGRTGRPLTEQEKAQGKHEIILARIPLSFVAGSGAGVKRLSATQLEAIFSGQLQNWKALGGADAPIVLVGREPTEAAFSELKNLLPFLAHSRFERIFKRDHQVVNFLNAKQGRYAIAFGARDNFSPQNLLEVEDLKAGLRVGLVYDQKNTNHVLVQQVKDFVGSAGWEAVVRQYHYLPN